MGPIEIWNWLTSHYQPLSAAAFLVVALARIIVKLTPTPEDDSALESIITALKHVALHIPTDGAPASRLPVKPDAPTSPPPPTKLAGGTPALLWLGALSLLLGGCVQTRFRLADGTTFTTTRLLWQGEITHAEIGLTNGAHASIEAYKSDAAAIAGAVARGVTEGLKP